jgi:hypothetical protein
MQTKRKAKGLVSAAILGTADFDVAVVDPYSVRLAGVESLEFTYQGVASLLVPFIDKQDGESRCGDCRFDPVQLDDCFCRRRKKARRISVHPAWSVQRRLHEVRE